MDLEDQLLDKEDCHQRLDFRLLVCRRRASVGLLLREVLLLDFLVKLLLSSRRLDLVVVILHQVLAAGRRKV